MVAHSPDIFARMVIDLMKDERLRKAISHSARILIKNNYTWEKALSKLNLIVNGIKA